MSIACGAVNYEKCQTKEMGAHDCRFTALFTACFTFQANLFAQH